MEEHPKAAPDDDDDDDDDAAQSGGGMGSYSLPVVAYCTRSDITSEGGRGTSRAQAPRAQAPRARPISPNNHPH